MPLSLLRWSTAVLVLCLLAPPAFAGAEPRESVPKEAQKRRVAKLLVQRKQLVRISGGALLRHDAAAAFERMYSEARNAGLWLWVISGHRSWEEQRYLYRLYRLGLGARAARPGRSNHQRGTALDISVGSTATLTYGWLAANACRFGFKRTVNSEPWHWEYRPRTTPTADPGEDCLGRSRVPPSSGSQAVATPSPS